MPNKSEQSGSPTAEVVKEEATFEMNPMPYIKEEQTSSDESRTKQKSSARRHRASVACTSCRDRRIRCVVPAGKKACVQCDRSTTLCIIRDDDERRKPISRAYVYSLVERVALLEQMLEDQGLTVPPANHPPETRHRSRRSKNTSSADNVSSLSSTPQDSSVSEDHATSPPHYFVNQGSDERKTPNKRKMSSSLITANNENHLGNKRIRHDSLIAPAEVKVESPINDLLDSVTHYDGTFEFEQTTNESNRPSFWPMTYDHMGGLTALNLPPQDTNVDYPAFSTWSDTAFEIDVYNDHVMTAQHGELHDAYRFNAGHPSIGVTTNLDFMAMGTSS
ncbi:fungal specific transcription factor domain-containing protein [Stagonosporopsis vannaccii]|nr:fungal specific transcription factor domain-containing protein [Stagonosporopsis vannaccii]